MNPVKNFDTIRLQLNETNVLEVVILLMIYLIKYVFQIRQTIEIYMFLIQLQEKLNKKF